LFPAFPSNFNDVFNNTKVLKSISIVISTRHTNTTIGCSQSCPLILLRPKSISIHIIATIGGHPFTLPIWNLTQHIVNTWSDCTLQTVAFHLLVFITI
jgi:hypothetical protein